MQCKIAGPGSSERLCAVRGASEHTELNNDSLNLALPNERPVSVLVPLTRICDGGCMDDAVLTRSSGQRLLGHDAVSISGHWQRLSVSPNERGLGP